jgi:hypothetical protein
MAKPAIITAPADPERSMKLIVAIIQPQGASAQQAAPI